MCNVNMVKTSLSERQRKLDRYGRELKSHGPYLPPPTSRDKQMQVFRVILDLCFFSADFWC